MQLKIKIDLIDLKNSPDLRENLREDAVDAYADRYENKLPMDDIILFKQRDCYWLADGRHRLLAMKRLGWTECTADVRIGDATMCWETAVKANARHGTQWSKNEKRSIVEQAVKRYPKKSHREIALMLGFSHTYVDQVVSENKPSSENKSVASSCQAKSAKNWANSSGDQTKTVNPAPAQNGHGTTPATPTKPEVVTDIMGYPIPVKVLPYFKRMEEIKKFINELHAIHRNIMIFADLRDVLWIGVNFQDVDVYTHNLVTALRRALPEVVCVQCQGHPEINPDNKCPRCHGKGLISKFDYDLPTVSDAMRKLREKAIDAITEKHKQQKGTERLSATVV